MEELYDVLCCHTGELLMSSVTLTAAQEYTASRNGRRVTQSDDPPEDYWVDIPEVAKEVVDFDAYMQKLREHRVQGIGRPSAFVEVTKKSTLTGIEHTRMINATENEINRWRKGALIQNALPHLSDEDRDFLMTGVTPEEWDAHFGEEVTMDRALGG